MDDFNKICDLSEKALSQLQILNKSVKSINDQFKQASDEEISVSFEDRIRRINEEDAEKSIKEYEGLLFIMEAEGIPINKIPADIHKSIGINYYRLERWQNAIDELLVYAKDEPKDTKALFSIGFCCHNLGNHKKATEYFRAITKINAQDSFAYYSWGVALKALYWETRDSDYLKQAIEKYKKTIEIKSDYFEAFHDWGNALDNLYNENKILEYLKQAIEKYAIAIKINPDYSQAHCNLTYALTLLFHAERKSIILDDALMHAIRAVELCPENRSYYYNVACVYSLKEMKKEMLKQLKEVIDFDSKHKKMAREDEDFTKYRDDPDFIILTKSE